MEIDPVVENAVAQLSAGEELRKTHLEIVEQIAAHTGAIRETTRLWEETQGTIKVGVKSIEPVMSRAEREAARLAERAAELAKQQEVAPASNMKLICSMKKLTAARRELVEQQDTINHSIEQQLSLAVQQLKYISVSILNINDNYFFVQGTALTRMVWWSDSMVYSVLSFNTAFIKTASL